MNDEEARPVKGELSFSSQEQLHAVLEALLERERQDETFGEQNHDPAYWTVILTEQTGQVAQAICDMRWGGGDRYKVKHQVTQVVAVGLAMMECLERGTFADDITTAKPTDKRKLAKALGVGAEAINYSKDDPDD